VILLINKKVYKVLWSWMYNWGHK